MNSKSEDLLAIAQQFEQYTEDAEASLLADILRVAAKKDFSGLIGLRDRVAKDEDPNFHPFRLEGVRLSAEERLALREKSKKSFLI